MEAPVRVLRQIAAAVHVDALPDDMAGVA